MGRRSKSKRKRRQAARQKRNGKPARSGSGADLWAEIPELAEELATALEAERELRGHFQGRRKAPRTPIALRAELVSPSGVFHACTIDLSSTGGLFWISDRSIRHQVRADDLAEYSRIVEACFGDGLTVQFGGGVLRRKMRLVRTTLGGLGGLSVPQLACRFNVPLDARECDLLGIAGGVHAGPLEVLLVTDE